MNTEEHSFTLQR